MSWGTCDQDEWIPRRRRARVKRMWLWFIMGIFIFEERVAVHPKPSRREMEQQERSVKLIGSSGFEVMRT
jgi:hypothetical protein